MENMPKFPVIRDTYAFECTQCANCCSGEQRVWLNPRDLRLMAVFLGMDHTGALFENDYVLLDRGEHGAWRPRILFKKFKQLLFCPFLENHIDDSGHVRGFCRLHPENKPLICHLAPLGRAWDAETGSDQWLFVKPAADCPGVNSTRKNRLSDTLDRYRHRIEEETLFYQKLNQLRISDSPRRDYQSLYLFNVSFHRIG